MTPPARPRPPPAAGALPPVLAVEDLVLRRADPADAPAVTEAVNASRSRLAPWLAWARRPARRAETALRLALAAAAFDAGGHGEWTVAPAAGGTPVVGGCGLYQTPDAGCRQIGYWVRSGWTGRGVASRSAAAMAWAAFAVVGLDRVEIRCDVANVGSSAVARRLGFSLLGTEAADPVVAPVTGRCQVWALERSGWAASAAAGWAVEQR